MTASIPRPWAELPAERLDDVVGVLTDIDQTMFGAFALSVGVANLLRFERSLTVWPAFLTRGERGAGFAEVAQSLLARRTFRKPAG